MMHIALLLVLIMVGCMRTFAGTVDLNCWIVADDNGIGSFTEESINNLVNEVNELYRQVALSFVIKRIVPIRDTALSIVDLNDAAQQVRLCSIASNTGGLEMYFVKELRGRATALHRRTGIIIGPSANGRTVGHEIGHACGLSDIYCSYGETELCVSGSPTWERLPHDWGWYPPAVSQADIVKRLLMYGYASSQKADISSGDIYGLFYTRKWNSEEKRWGRVWRLGNASVGFGTHGSRHPASQ